jgi:hypothetical protein
MQPGLVSSLIMELAAHFQTFGRSLKDFEGSGVHSTGIRPAAFLHSMLELVKIRTNNKFQAL